MKTMKNKYPVVAYMSIDIHQAGRWAGGQTVFGKEACRGV
jgi:hypothetical protein